MPWILEIHTAIADYFGTTPFVLMITVKLVCIIGWTWLVYDLYIKPRRQQ
jgi:hypothetical protein